MIVLNVFVATFVVNPLSPAITAWNVVSCGSVLLSHWNVIELSPTITNPALFGSTANVDVDNVLLQDVATPWWFTALTRK